MNRILRLAIITLLLTAPFIQPASVQATERPWYATCLRALIGEYETRSTAEYPVLTFQEAREIVGPLGPGGMGRLLRRGLQHIVSTKYKDHQHLAENLNQIVLAVKAQSQFSWDFERIEGSDGSVLFMGGLGQGIVVTPDSMILRGTLDAGAAREHFDKESYAHFMRVWPDDELN